MLSTNHNLHTTKIDNKEFKKFVIHNYYKLTICFEIWTSWCNFFQDYLQLTQPGFTCSKLVIEILEQGVKYVQS